MYLWCDTHTAQHPHAKTRYSERGQAVPLQKCLMWRVYSSVCVCVCVGLYTFYIHTVFSIFISALQNSSTPTDVPVTALEEEFSSEFSVFL